MATDDRLKGKKTLKVNDILDDIEKDEIKKRVDIITLFASFGVELKQKGKGYVGLCPWHTDNKTPSLSVDRVKGLYNCFGCGESGDIVTLVEKMKGYGFREAMDYLKKEGSSGKYSPAAIVVAPQEKSIPQAAEEKTESAPPQAEPGAGTKEEENGEPTQEQKREEEAQQKLLALKVIEHYHQTLITHEQALAYLSKRGLNRPELIKHYKVGYADGKSLTAKISATQKELLKGAGFITARGEEHFKGCLVFPIFKEDGSLGEGYGRSINGHQPAHRYLPGPHQGLFNYPALRVYEELYFTESIVDALSLIALGILNVSALYGANGFTEEHLTFLKEGKRKNVILALDNDEAGKAACGKLKDKLLAEGLRVRAIFPPLKLTADGTPIKDWNDYLLSGGSKEAVLKLVSESTECENEREGLKLKKTAEGYLFEKGDISYRITGVKLEESGSSLKATVKLSYHGESIFDTVELYSQRSRGALLKEAVYRLGVKSEEVEKHLSALIAALEEEKENFSAKKPEAAGKVKLSNEEVELGLKFLTDPALIQSLASDLSQIGLIDEPMSKLLLYLIATSRKRAEPLSAYIIGRSSGGKSWLVNRIMALLPEEEALKLSSASDVAFYYTGSELKGKVVVLGEFVGAENIEKELRELISEGKISRLVTTKDAESGAMKYSRVTAYGPIAFISTTTNPDVNAENLSRCLVLYADESEGQTEKILKFQRQLKGPRGPYLKLGMSEIIKKHHIVQTLLEDVEIINPFCDYIDFPTLILKGRRVHVNFLLVIEMIAFLYQKQREVKSLEVGGKVVRYIQCSLQDYRLAYQIMMSGILENTLDEMPKAAKDFYAILSALRDEKAASEKKERENILLSRRQMVERSGWSPKQVRLYVEKLLEYECLEVVAGFGRGEQHKYRLLKRNELVAGLLRKIPAPEEVERRMREAVKESTYTDSGPEIF